MDTSIPWTFQRKGAKWFRSVTTGVNSTYLTADFGTPLEGAGIYNNICLYTSSITNT